MSADVTESMTAEACWRVLERVAACSTLKRAARLREFLFYVGAKSLKEGRSDLHEQEIGHLVFGREKNYDTSQDNIVRVSASELRKRVDAFFATEGKDEPLIFEIPRGSYVPQFRLRNPVEASEPVTAAPANEPVAVPAQPRERKWAVWILAIVAAVLALACALLWRQNVLLRRQMQPVKSAQALGSANTTWAVATGANFSQVEE